MADYTPSAQYRAALEEFERTKEAHEAAKKALRAATADELKSSGIASKAFAPQSPWSEETLRGIANEYGVPPKRAATVQAIAKPKTRKRTAGGKTSG